MTNNPIPWPTHTGRMTGKSTYIQSLQQIRKELTHTPWLDSKGFARLDVKREWMQDGSHITVSMKAVNEISITPYWQVMLRTPAPKNMTSAERKRTKLSCAELVGIKLGVPYKLRGTL